MTKIPEDNVKNVCRIGKETIQDKLESVASGRYIPPAGMLRADYAAKVIREGIARIDKLAAKEAYEILYRVLDEALIIGPQTTLDSFETPKLALEHLIGWEVKVATDPCVNGGYVLVKNQETDKK